MGNKAERILDSLKIEVSQEVSKEILSRCGEVATDASVTKQSKWVKSFIDNADLLIDENTRIKIMENCGKQCISKSTINKAIRAKKDSKDLDEFLSKLNELHIGGGCLKREGNLIYGFYKKCYCGLVNKNMGKMSSTYCNCSRGWYQQLFESVFEKSVRVELEDSIMQGADECSFKIHIDE